MFNTDLTCQRLERMTVNQQHTLKCNTHNFFGSLLRCEVYCTLKIIYQKDGHLSMYDLAKRHQNRCTLNLCLNFMSHPDITYFSEHIVQNYVMPYIELPTVCAIHSQGKKSKITNSSPKYNLYLII